MISNFKYSYISFEDYSYWSQSAKVNLSINYNSHNVNYNFNLNDKLSSEKG